MTILIIVVCVLSLICAAIVGIAPMLLSSQLSQDEERNRDERN